MADFDGIGIILSNEIVKSALINFGRTTIYSAAPPFPFVAAIRAGHRLLGTPEMIKVRHWSMSRHGNDGS
jgi:8-amino-7-oxononanoate synthase